MRTLSTFWYRYTDIILASFYPRDYSSDSDNSDHDSDEMDDSGIIIFYFLVFI